MKALEISHFDHPELDRRLQTWLGGLRALEATGIVLLGPQLDQGLHDRVIRAASHTHLFSIAQDLIHLLGEDTLGSVTQRLVGVLTLNQAPERIQNFMRQKDVRSIIWVALPLPVERRLECVYFSQLTMPNNDQMAQLTLSAMTHLPQIITVMAQAQDILSPKERRCLQLAFQGLTTKEIAASAGLTERTANYHMTNAMLKLKVKNKMAAALRACWLGLI